MTLNIQKVSKSVAFCGKKAGLTQILCYILDSVRYKACTVYTDFVPFFSYIYMNLVDSSIFPHGLIKYPSTLFLVIIYLVKNISRINILERKRRQLRMHWILLNAGEIVIFTNKLMLACISQRFEWLLRWCYSFFNIEACQ